MKILFAASEAVPFAASGGLADVVGSLPKAIKSKRHDCRVVMPLYKSVAPEFRDKMVFVTNITVDVSWRKQYCGIFMAIQDGITYYFIDNEYYFSRDGLYGFYDDCGKEVHSELMGIPMYNAGLIEYDGSVNMMKGAIETSDMITTVSPSYAWEILDPWYAHGLDRILVTKQYKLRGIMNGIDTKLYDPEKDKFIAVNYSAKKVAGKEKCKEAILAELGLTPGDEPLIGIVTRFVRHKGIDLIRCVFEEMVRSGIKFAVLGSGEKIYEDFFLEMAARYPDKVSVTVGFIPELSHRIYAGADMFLMPSQSEPCGLAQMIAMRYGTIPIVRETGGLRDSVRDNGGENGNGFTFKTYNANDMLDAVKRARKDYEDKQVWDELVERAMECDHSWSSSAEMYIDTYKELLAAE